MLDHLAIKFYFISSVSLLIGISLLDGKVDSLALKFKDLSEDNEKTSQDIVLLDGRWDWNKKSKFTCPQSDGTFSDVENCSKYYVCKSGRASHRSCSRNKRFDRYRKKCMPFVIAVCDDGKDDQATTESDQNTTPKNDKFSCPSFTGSFPHPEDCSKYYSCTFFIPTLKTCPEDKLFDGVKKECKPANEVHCGSRKRPTSETTEVTIPLTSTASSIETTPEPTTTEPTTLQPTTPEITTPEPTTPEPTTPEPKTPEPTTPEPTTPEPTTPEPTTPESTTPEPTTPEPTTPEPTTPEPTGPPDTDCDEDDLDCIIEGTGGDNPKWFKCPEPVGSYGHPSSNKLFIFCKNWKPYTKKCGQDLIFSEEVRTCISP